MVRVERLGNDRGGGVDEDRCLNELANRGERRIRTSRGSEPVGNCVDAPAGVRKHLALVARLRNRLLEEAEARQRRGVGPWPMGTLPAGVSAWARHGLKARRQK